MPVQLRAFELKSLITKDLLEYRRSFQQKPGICSWPSPRFCEEKLFEARFPPRTKTAKKRTQIVWAPIIPTRQDSESGPPLCLVRDSRILRPAGGRRRPAPQPGLRFRNGVDKPGSVRPPQKMFPVEVGCSPLWSRMPRPRRSPTAPQETRTQSRIPCRKEPLLSSGSDTARRPSHRGRRKRLIPLSTARAL